MGGEELYLILLSELSVRVFENNVVISGGIQCAINKHICVYVHSIQSNCSRYSGTNFRRRFISPSVDITTLLFIILLSSVTDPAILFTFVKSKLLRER